MIAVLAFVVLLVGSRGICVLYNWRSSLPIDQFGGLFDYRGIWIRSKIAWIIQLDKMNTKIVPQPVECVSEIATSFMLLVSAAQFIVKWDLIKYSRNALMQSQCRATLVSKGSGCFLCYGTVYRLVKTLFDKLNETAVGLFLQKPLWR